MGALCGGPGDGATRCERRDTDCQSTHRLRPSTSTASGIKALVLVGDHFRSSGVLQPACSYPRKRNVAAVAVYCKHVSVHRGLGALSPAVGHGGTARSPGVCPPASSYGCSPGILRPAFSYIGDGRKAPAAVYSKIALCERGRGAPSALAAKQAVTVADGAAPTTSRVAGTLRGRDGRRQGWSWQCGRRKRHHAADRNVWCPRWGSPEAGWTAARVQSEPPALPAVRKVGSVKDSQLFVAELW
jgi:hypothetical protein